MHLSPHCHEKRMQTLKVSFKLSYCQSLHVNIKGLIIVTDTIEENFLLKELVTFTSNINGKNNQKKSLRRPCRLKKTITLI